MINLLNYLFYSKIFITTDGLALIAQAFIGVYVKT